MTVIALFTGSGRFSSNNAAELVIRSSGVDTVNARNGTDCVVGGIDVGFGGPGTDTNTGARCETFVD